MSEHSITEAEERLSELIDRALAGEGIVITREGRPAVELKPLRVKTSPRPMTAEDLAWLAERRVGLPMPKQSAGELLSEMRDEEQR